MIVTITCNPAIDKTIYEDKTIYNIGGKGINVSKVLKQLDCDTLCLGFMGKDNSDLFLNELDKLNIKHDFVLIDGSIRTNTKRIIDNELYEDNEIGPEVNDIDKNKLFNKLEELNNDIAVISGSAPINVEDDFYEKMILTLKKNNNYVILDCSKNLFKYGLKAKPDVIKPNEKEISEYFNEDLNQEELIDKTKQLNLDLSVISLGSKGALFISDDVYYSPALNVEYKSALGAGDSMVGALAYSKLHNYNIVDTIKLAMSCAGASVETSESNPPDRKRIEDHIKEVVINKVG